MFAIWIMLVLSTISSIYFAYFLLNNIDVISEILVKINYNVCLD